MIVTSRYQKMELFSFRIKTKLNNDLKLDYGSEIKTDMTKTNFRRFGKNLEIPVK